MTPYCICIPRSGEEQSHIWCEGRCKGRVLEIQCRRRMQVELCLCAPTSRGRTRQAGHPNVHPDMMDRINQILLCSVRNRPGHGRGVHLNQGKHIPRSQVPKIHRGQLRVYDITRRVICRSATETHAGGLHQWLHQLNCMKKKGSWSHHKHYNTWHA